MRAKIAEINPHKVTITLPSGHLLSDYEGRELTRTYIQRLRETKYGTYIEPFVWEELHGRRVAVGSKLYRSYGTITPLNFGHLKVDIANEDLIDVIRREYRQRYREQRNHWDNPWK